MKKGFLILWALIFPFSWAFPQQKIEGIVFDAQTSQRVSQVFLYNTQLDTGVFNNLKGEFFMPAVPGDVLLVAAEGYFADTVMVSNESTLILYLHRSSIWIKDVHVFGQKSPDEMLKENKEAYPSAFKERQSILSAGPSGVGLSIDALFSLVSREGRNARNLRRVLERDYREAMIDYRFSKTLVSTATGLKGDELEEFMFNFKPSYYFVMAADDYKMARYVKHCFEQYKRNPNFRRMDPLIPDPDDDSGL